MENLEDISSVSGIKPASMRRPPRWLHVSAYVLDAGCDWPIAARIAFLIGAAVLFWSLIIMAFV
jgi:hypothetical protein